MAIMRSIELSCPSQGLLTSLSEMPERPVAGVCTMDCFFTNSASFSSLAGSSSFCDSLREGIGGVTVCSTACGLFIELTR